MRLRYANLAVILASPILSPAAQVTGVTTIAGTLQPELVPNSVVGQTESLKPASAQERGALPVQLGTTDRVFTGVTFFRKKDDVMLALVEPADGRPYLFADVNQNGSFEEFYTKTGAQAVLLFDPRLRLLRASSPSMVKERLPDSCSTSTRTALTLTGDGREWT